MPADTRPDVPDRSLVRLRVSLLGSDPEIWRLIEVDSALRLHEFHIVLQIVMGWEDSHLHAFRDDDPFAASPRRTGDAPRRWLPPAVVDDDADGMPEEDYSVGQLLTGESGPVYYAYDFGDGWIHRIDWIESIDSIEKGRRGARLLSGERRGPLEDSGGIGGYAEILTILADPAHDEHDGIREWVGDMFEDPGEFDPAAFDVAEVDRQLSRIFR